MDENMKDYYKKKGVYTPEEIARIAANKAGDNSIDVMDALKKSIDTKISYLCENGKTLVYSPDFDQMKKWVDICAYASALEDRPDFISREIRKNHWGTRYEAMIILKFQDPTFTSSDGGLDYLFEILDRCSEVDICADDDGLITMHISVDRLYRSDLK